MESLRGHCPVCRDTVGSHRVSCPACHAPHHGDCWRYNRGCAIFGCDEAPAIDAAPGIAMVEPAKRAAPLPDRPRPFQSVYWKIADACILTVSYAAIAALCALASTPVLLIPLTLYLPH